MSDRASYGVGERPELKSYWQAERYGRKYGHCGAIFPSCPVSIFSLVTDEGDEDDAGDGKKQGQRREGKRKPRTGRTTDFDQDTDDVEED